MPCCPRDYHSSKLTAATVCCIGAILFLSILLTSGYVSRTMTSGQSSVGTTLQDWESPVQHSDATMTEFGSQLLDLQPTAKRPRLSTVTDFQQCILCQCITDERLCTPGRQGIDRFLLVSNVRNDNYLRVWSRVENAENVEHIQTGSIVKWHPSCYSGYTSKSNVPCAPCTETPQKDKPTPQTRLSTNHGCRFDQSRCVICQRLRCKKGSTKLCAVTTIPGQESLLAAARARQDDVLLRIAGVDMVAQNVKYHRSCRSAYVAPRNLMFSPVSKRDMDTDNETDKLNNTWALAFANLIKRIDKPLMDDGVAMDINTVTRTFNQLLETEGEQSETCNNRRVKRMLEKHYGDRLTFQGQASKNLSQLMYSNDISREHLVCKISELTGKLQSSQQQQSIPQGCPDNASAVEMLHVATKLRADLAVTIAEGQGDRVLNISQGAAATLVPDSMYTFLRCLLTDESDDRKIDALKMPYRHPDDTVHNTILSLGQDILYQASNRRQNTPKHIGIGLAVHQATRSKDVVQLLHAAGSAVSYEQLQRIDTAIAREHLRRFEGNGHVIVPRNLRPGRFVHFAGDNIDVLEETLDGKGTFHATQMAAFQVGPASEEAISVPLGGRDRVLAAIPPEFHQMCSAGMESHQRPSPAFGNCIGPTTSQPHSEASLINAEDLPWLLSRLVSPTMDQKVPAWTGFNTLVSTSKKLQDVIGHMPIINAPAHEYDSIWTVIVRAKAIAAHLGQKHTVLTFDQALYCRAKEVTWLHPGECQDVIIRLGGFHTAMNFLKVIGQHFADSGLKDIWVEAGVYSDCTAERILEGKAWNRAVRAHKLTFEALWRCLWPEFQQWCELNGHQVTLETATKLASSIEDGDLDQARLETMQITQEVTDPLRDFAADQTTGEHSTTIFWLQYMRMVSTLLSFIRAEREGNWAGHLSALDEMLPLFMVYNHTNYARWGPVYRKDMADLPISAPEVQREFEAGNFGVRETTGPFNQIHADQALEHVNLRGKLAGGVVGITRTEPALDRWGINFNDRSSISERTYEMFGLNPQTTPGSHKDMGASRITRDEADVMKLAHQFQNFGIFKIQGADLVSLSTKDVAPSDVKDDLLSVTMRGEEQLHKFTQTRMSEPAEVDFYLPLKKVPSKTFSTIYKVDVTKPDGMTKTIKADRDLFRRLLVASQAGRDVNLGSLVKHELAPVPLALAKMDRSLNQSDKATLAHVLEAAHSLEELPASPGLTCCIIDAMALVRSIGTLSDAKSFGHLADAFIGSVLSHFTSTCSRIDVVFDSYREVSIKCATRHKRAGKTRLIRRIIRDRDVPLPADWSSFINLTANKVNLVEFLASQLRTTQLPDDCELIIAGGFDNPETTVSSTGRPTTHLESSQEEADTRMILHAADAANCDYQRVIILSQDTDVLVLLVHFADRLPSEIWMRAGTSKKRRYIPVHDISQHHGATICKVLPAFHAFTGCDTVSQFAGHGKKTCWKHFATNPEVFDDLGVGPLNQPTVEKMEQFVVHLYSQSSDLKSVDELRCLLLNVKSPDKLPPTSDALLQHTKRAHYQALVWLRSLEAKPGLPDVEDFGWVRDAAQLTPRLLTLAPVPSACLELVNCGCKSKCGSVRCSCRKGNLACTAACGCARDGCKNPHNPEELDDVHSH